MNAIHPGSFLTLHYRLSAADGADLVKTFDDRPATLSLGTGELAPAMEARLIGLQEGARARFELAAGEAFGERNPELIQVVSKKTLDDNSEPDANYQVGDLVDFRAPGGGRFAGMLREMKDNAALFDFNHPLAGQPVTFEVHVIGVL